MRLSYRFLQTFPRAPARTARYGLAIVVSGLTLLIGLLLDQVFGGIPPLVLFIVPVAVSAWYGGLRSGLLATLLGGLGYSYFLLEPQGSLHVLNAAYWMRLALFLAIGWLVSWLIETTHAVRRRAEADARAAKRWGKDLADQIAERERAKAERERLIEELDTERARLKAIIENIPAALLMVEAPSGRIVMANPRFEEMFSHPMISSPDIESYRDWVAYHPNGQPYQSHEHPMARAFHGEVVQNVEALYERGDGGWKGWLRVSAAPVRDASGKIIGAVGLGTDIDEEKQSREALRQSQERLNLAQKAARIGSFEWNVQTNVNIWSEEVEVIYGLPPGSFGGTYEAWAKCVHPEDLPRAEQDVQRALVDGEYRSEWRVIWPDGSVHWIQAQGKVYYDERGRPLRIFGINMDITERKRIEAIIDGHRQALELAVHEVPLGAILEVITRTVEAQACDDVLASILLLDSDGAHLRHGAGSSLPESYNRAIDGAAIGPSAGSCGTAAYTGRTIVVSDIANDPLWVGYRELALEHGLRACWSTPIRSSHGKVLGTFALYYREARNPTPRDQEIVDLLTHTAAVVIEREQESRERVAAEHSLREADRRKDEFLATLAHELRNPLAPICNNIQILAKLGDDPAVVAQASEAMDRQVHQMIRLVDDLLEVSRIGQGKISLQKASVDLAEVVATAVEISRPLVEAHHHKLTVSLPDCPVRIEADAARLAQVLSNLLNNAAKYTKAGGRIDLIAERVNGEAMLRVRDNGIGIAPEMLPQVFDMFMQVESATDRSHGGLGIGLTLVRRLVEMHGGKIEAHSAGLGKGSEFLVRLPALTESLAKPTRKPAEDFSARAANGSRRILIVDDNLDSAESMAVLLQLDGHDVRVAHDGLAALEEARAFQPDVMFLDLNLPEMDGYEVARRLRLEPALGDMTLIAMTGYGQEEDRQRTQEAGFHLHLVKPVDFDMLHEFLLSLPANKSRIERGRGVGASY